MGRHGGLLLALSALSTALLAMGCDGTNPPADGGSDGVCRSSVECSDGVFCNGAELCDPTHPAADMMGCLPGSAPCLASQTCDEANAICESDCAVAPDADGDGADAILCGGDDCDDSRADRFPGNMEICDAEGVDEDCDPSTLGTDGDGDGEVGDQCCNLIGGVLECGNDCDDTRASVGPGATEVCNGIDEDCDGTLDEGVLTLAYPDFDGDGFGNGRAGRERECDGDPLFASIPGDCDDSNPDVNPDAAEVCDGIDNDCDGDAGDEIDVDRDGYFDSASTCSGLTTPDCDDLNPTSFPGAPEQCNDVDDNCNGTIDERDGVSGADAQCDVRIGDASGFCADLGTRHACVISACPSDRADCDGNPANGCEIDIATDTGHCGACGIRCDGACVDGLCSAPPNGEVLDLSLGRDGGCVLREETPGSGEGWIGCWGEVWFVPLGPRPVPVLRADTTRVTDAVSIAASRNGLIYLDAAGDLYVVGQEDGRIEPTLVTGIPGPIAEVETGDYGACALTEAGALYCWRDEGFPWGSEEPTLRFSGESFQQVSLGDGHGCALRTDNQLICWGRNDSRQLGINVGQTARADVPGAYVRVGAGSQMTCAERTTGEVVCWGRHLFETEDFESADIEYLTGVTVQGLEVGHTLGCALTAGGEVRCFGGNASGAGDGLPCDDGLNGRGLGSCDDQTSVPSELMQCMMNTCRRPAVGVARAVRLTEFDELTEEERPRLLSGATHLSVNEESACAVVDAQRVVCWGLNDKGQLGTIESANELRVAHQQRLGSRVADVARGRDGTCARRADGSLLCWGYDNARQLGLPDGLHLSPREALAAPEGLRSISVGETTSCGVRSDGRAVCWGGVGVAGAVVPLGDGSAFDAGSATAVEVSGLTGVRSVSVAFRHACALVGDGEVHCWGDNTSGALGATSSDLCGGDACALTPIRVTLPGPAAEVVTAGIRAGEDSMLSFGDHSCARLVDGRVYCWGESRLGGLAQGPVTLQTDVPLAVPGITDAIDLDLSTSHGCALRADGRATCWGADLEGTVGGAEVCELGLRCHTTPFDVPVLTDGRAIQVGLAISCAIRDSGDVTCWGANSSGEAGDGTTASRVVPAGVATLPAPARSLALRYETSCATLVTDEVYCWGADTEGQAGDGPQRELPDEANLLLPSEVPGL
ncbi:MAG: MopE-related protein [Sandaracinaceae bacterium]